MDQLRVYETCGVIGGTLRSYADRAAFAALLRAWVAGRSTAGRLRPVADALPDTARPLLVPLMQSVTGRHGSARTGALRWLRDAGWVAR